MTILAQLLPAYALLSAALFGLLAVLLRPKILGPKKIRKV